MRVLTTFGFGPHAAFLHIAVPTFAKYASTHGYDLFVPARPPVGFDRPASWAKVLLVSSLLNRGYDEVLWIDSDVVVRRFDRDIADDCDEKPLHMVVHETSDGSVPNSGVWFVKRGAEEFLSHVWGRTGSRRESGWWEQAAIIDCLGGDSNAEKVSVPAGPLWGQLPYEWNPHAWDVRGIPNNARFFHATMLHDRAAAMRRAIGDPT